MTQGLIPADTTIRGSIEGPGGLVVEGRVEGTIDLGGDLRIGVAASVEGEIRARRLTIAGTIQGNVAATESIELLASSRIEGDLRAPRLAIAEGAIVRGRVELGGEAPGKAVAAPETVQAPVALDAPAPDEMGGLSRVEAESPEPMLGVASAGDAIDPSALKPSVTEAPGVVRATDAIELPAVTDVSRDSSIVEAMEDDGPGVVRATDAVELPAVADASRDSSIAEANEDDGPPPMPLSALAFGERRKRIVPGGSI